jgi:hypothetical protein
MKKKLIRIALILTALGLFSATGTYLYVFHKPHRNIAKEKPAYILDAGSLISDFSSDETASYEKYGNKVLQVSGEVVDISVSDNSASITLLDQMEGINCSFDSLEVVNSKSELEQLNVGNKVDLKGQCDGYDMIMGVVLTRCVFAK